MSGKNQNITHSLRKYKKSLTLFYFLDKKEIIRNNRFAAGNLTSSQCVKRMFIEVHMPAHHQVSSVSRVQIPTFDLSDVVEQLSHKPEYSHWTEARFQTAVQEYCKFLAMHKMYPDRMIIPGRDVDSIWHRHILNTKRYMSDCEAYFGHYLHHSPHSRIMEGSQEANQMWRETLRLYEEMFGVKPKDGWLSGMSICNGGCDGGACSPGKCT
jgi:hypothetical protein